MWNEVFNEHRKRSPHCEGYITWDLSAEQKWGAAWREKATCTECGYNSKMFNLYNEVVSNKRGRRTAAINLAIQVALSHIAISTTGLQKLFMGSNIPAPSTSGMQHSANLVSEIIEEYNNKDLSERRKLIKQINKLRGDNPEIINVQADCVYNNPIYSGVGKTPFQPATQCTYNVAENNTYKHSIVSSRQQSKLCSNKKKHKTKTKVGSHSGHCSANIEIHDSIGNEERWAKNCFLDLKNDGLEVGELTTDPDSSAYRAAESLYESGETKTQPIHFLDTRHVSSNQRKFVRRLAGLKEIMPTRLVKDKEKLLGRFSIDIADRCQAEHSCLLKQE